MPRVTGLDGKVYELDDATLEKCRITDEELQKWGDLPPLPPPPAPVAAPSPPPRAAAPQIVDLQQHSKWVRVRRGPNNSTIIELTPPGV
jgi:hypothetical protein